MRELVINSIIIRCWGLSRSFSIYFSAAISNIAVDGVCPLVRGEQIVQAPGTARRRRRCSTTTEYSRKSGMYIRSCRGINLFYYPCSRQMHCSGFIISMRVKWGNANKFWPKDSFKGQININTNIIKMNFCFLQICRKGI